MIKNPTKRKPRLSGLQTVDLSIIIVNYNVKEFLEQALISVQKALSQISAEVIVVDNASRDGSQTLVRERFPEVKLIANRENLGFAKSSNQGVKAARGKYLLLLNPDTIVQEDTFVKLLEFFEGNPDAGMVGCKILNPDGSLQLACRRSFPTPWVAFTKLSGLSTIFSRSKLFGRYNLTYLDPDEPCAVEAISGSFMMVRRETIKDVGLLDESFFMYGEDLDWCYRIGQSPWKVMYYPGTQIIHFKGESSKKAQFDRLKVFYQAMGQFARKHFSQRYFLMPYWMLWLAIWLRAGVSFLGNLLQALAAPTADLVLLCSTIIFSIYWRFGSLDTLAQFVPVLAVYSLIWMVLLTFTGSYTQHKFSSSKAALAMATGFLINASLTFFFKQYAFSRAVVLMSSMISIFAIPAWRLAFKMLARTGLLPFKGTLGKTLLARNTLVVGDLESGQKLIQKLNSQVDSGYDISGLVSMNGSQTGEVLSGVEVLGAIDDLNDIIKANHIQEVIFSPHELSYDQILAIIAKSGNQRVNFKLIPSNLEVIIGKASIDRIEDVPLLEIDYKLHQKRYRLLKRGFDVCLACLTLLITLPLFLLKKSLTSASLQGKAIHGLNGEVTVQELGNKSQSILDKILYLWAVLKGDLSFVGSEMVEASESRATSVGLNLDLKPGLTGLVQVNARKQLSLEDKQRYQIYYLKNYSPLLDMEIIFKSLLNV
ncbi:MAG: glycosyltransferase [bacterium]